MTFGQGDDVTYPLTDIVNAAQAQQDAQTFAQKFSLDGVSTVIFVGDPITPVYFTGAAMYEERKFARSAVATEYAAYKQRTGRFIPKFGH